MIAVRWHQGTVVTCLWLTLLASSVVTNCVRADDEKDRQRAVARKEAGRWFDRYVMSLEGEDWSEEQERVREGLVNRGQARIRLINRWCDLNKLQERKLTLALRGEVNRLLDRITVARDKHIEAHQDDNMWWERTDAMQTLKFELQYGLLDEKTIFHKTLLATLTPDQLQKYRDADQNERMARHRARVASAVSILEFISPLKDDQRKRLCELIERKTPAPSYESSFATYVVLYRVSEFPHSDLQGILTSAQWKIWEPKVRQYQTLKPTLEQERLLGP